MMKRGMIRHRCIKEKLNRWHARVRADLNYVNRVVLILFKRPFKNLNLWFLYDADIIK